MNSIEILDSESIIFVLGAGASVDSNIPHAGKMVSEFEGILSGEKYLKEKELYLLLKSSILYQRGLREFNPSSVVSIEDILNVIESLKQKQENILYPFIGNWSNQLIKTSGENFEIVDKLDEMIRNSLYEWVTLDNYNISSYYCAIGSLSREVSFPIRIFSLNYDICVEEAFKKNSYYLESGFDFETCIWSYDRFDLPLESNVDAYLYKLHGSINWKRNEKGELITSASIPQDPQVIFGTMMKMKSLDPYLFSIYELRRCSLHSNLKFIVIVGYSFSDDHINKLIQQALIKNENLKLLIVDPCIDQLAQERILKTLNTGLQLGNPKIDIEKLIPMKKSARIFFENLSLDIFKQHLNSKDLPF